MAQTEPKAAGASAIAAPTAVDRSASVLPDPSVVRGFQTKAIALKPLDRHRHASTRPLHRRSGRPRDGARGRAER